MMPAFLAILQLIVLLMLLVTAYLGFGDHDPTGIFSHMYWGVATSILGMFGHTLVMFFLIGTSKAIRLMCKDHKPAWSFIERSNVFKRAVSGKSTMASMAFLIEPILGAASYSATISTQWHLLGFFVTLIVHVWVFGIELKCIGLNNLLMREVSAWKATGGMSEAEKDPGPQSADENACGC